MHNLIEDIILSFSPEELREFKYFLSGNNNIKTDREDIKLVDVIRKGETEAIQNSNAYHQTRKRLKKQLELFVQNQNVKTNVISETINLVEVARFFFKKNMAKQGWHYLMQAEELASKTDDYVLLDFVYDTQIAFASAKWNNSAPFISVPTMLKHRDKNLLSARRDAHANAAYILMLHEIQTLYSKEVYGNIDAVIQTALKKYNLEGDLFDVPKIYCKVVYIMCRALREKKDYPTLKNYALENYEALKTRKMLDKIPADFLMELIRSVYLASIRTADYENTEKFLQLYDSNKELFKDNPDEYLYYHFRSRLMAADLYMFTNMIGEAEKIFTQLLSQYSYENEKALVYFFLRVNLLALYFKLNNYNECITVYSGLIQKYRKQILKEEGLGLEMLLFTEIYGVIFYYETNDYDYALYLLNRTKRKYADLFNGDTLYREELFLKIIEKMLKQVSVKTNAKLRKECAYFLSLKQYIPGDKEYISLNAWLESKLSGESYYYCFLNPKQAINP